MRYFSHLPVSALGSLLVCVLVHDAASTIAGGQFQVRDLPNVTHSGYLDVNKDDGSQIFYSYYERQEHHNDASAPVLLWLQAGFHVNMDQFPTSLGI